MSAFLWTNEKRGIHRTQDDILVLNCAAPPTIQNLHFYRKPVKIFSLPQFQSDGQRQVAGRKSNRLDLTHMAVHNFLAGGLALTPLLASISALGIVRELVPGVALERLAPAGLGDSVRQGPQVGMSTAAIAAVLIVWAVAAVVLGGWRDSTRDA